jgi:hypothetical protein
MIDAIAEARRLTVIINNLNRNIDRIARTN